MRLLKNKMNIAIVFTMAIFSSLAQKGESGAYYEYEVKCLGSEMDGSVTLEVYGRGRNYFDASEQAKKNAVQAVIFKGIKSGNAGCSSDPILVNSSAQTKYEDYFAGFFKDEGAYLEFVSLKDERIVPKASRNAKKSKQSQQRMVVVRVDRLGLKKKLAADNIK